MFSRRPTRAGRGSNCRRSHPTGTPWPRSSPAVIAGEDRGHGGPVGCERRQLEPRPARVGRRENMGASNGIAFGGSWSGWPLRNESVDRRGLPPRGGVEAQAARAETGDEGLGGSDYTNRSSKSGWRPALSQPRDSAARLDSRGGLRVRVGSGEGRCQLSQARSLVRGGGHRLWRSLALLLPDPSHSSEEERYLALGRSDRDRLVVVAFAERPPELVSLAPDPQRAASAANMKKPRARRRPRLNPDRDTMRPEYDFSKAVRGAIAARFRQGTNLVVVDPAVRDVFPDSDAVNEALRALAPVLRRRRKAPSKRRST